MPRSLGSKPVTFMDPASYRIRVVGNLDQDWSERLGGMTIRRTTSKNIPRVTDLVGCLPDQAALAGVLNALYEMRLPLLSVELLDNAKHDPEEV